MKPQLLKFSPQPQQSFKFTHEITKHFFNKWHYHDEIELVYIIKGTGYQLIGDNMSRFKSGDILLVGSGLPHYWKSDEQHHSTKETGVLCESLAIHFNPGFLGKDFFQLPENIAINHLFEKAKNGLRIEAKTRKDIAAMMHQLTGATNSNRIILLLQILERLSTSHDLVKMCENAHFGNLCNEDDRLSRIYQFVMHNLGSPLKLCEIASVANLTPNSFCRYFKSRTKKSFSKFLIESRINHACKLLIESSLPIADICYESGFNNFSNFNRHFKNVTNSTPLELRKMTAKTA